MITIRLFRETGYIVINYTLDETIKRIKKAFESKVPLSFFKMVERENKVMIGSWMGPSLLNISLQFIPFENKTRVDYVVKYSKLYVGYITGMIAIISMVFLLFSPTIKDIIYGLFPIILIVMGMMRFGLFIYSWRLKRRWKIYQELDRERFYFRH